MNNIVPIIPKLFQKYIKKIFKEFTTLSLKYLKNIVIKDCSSASLFPKKKILNNSRFLSPKKVKINIGDKIIKNKNIATIKSLLNLKLLKARKIIKNIIDEKIMMTLNLWEKQGIKIPNISTWKLKKFVFSIFWLKTITEMIKNSSE